MLLCGISFYRENKLKNEKDNNVELIKKLQFDIVNQVDLRHGQ